MSHGRRSCKLKSLSRSWIRWSALSLLAIFVLVTAPEPVDTIAVRTFRQGEALASGDMYEQDSDGTRSYTAEEAYQRVIARRPSDPQPWRRLGDFYAAWGQSDDALYAYGQAIRRGDEGTALDRSLARLYAGLGDYRRSTRRWVDYLARRPEDRAARLSLALTAIRLAEWEQARAELARLLDDVPDDPVAHAWLGLLLIGPDPATGTSRLQRADDDPAVAAFLAPVFDAERLSVASDDPAYRSALLGIAFLKLDVSQLRRNHPVMLEFTGELTQVTAMLAQRSLLVAIYRNPAYADAYAYLGQVFDQLDRPGWARTSLRRALQLAPQSPVVLTLMGMYWNRHNAPELARRYFEIVHERDPGNVTLYLEIAATYAAENNYTAAEVWLLLATRTAPDDPQVWEALAHFYLESGIGVEESGLAAVTQLLRLAPNDARAFDLAGWAYFLLDRDTQAETSLRHALALDPTLASAHYHLGRLYADQGRYLEATQSYRRAGNYDVEGQLAADLERAWSDLPQR